LALLSNLLNKGEIREAKIAFYNMKALQKMV